MVGAGGDKPGWDTAGGATAAEIEEADEATGEGNMDEVRV